MINRKPICLCAECREMLFEGDSLVDYYVYDFDGELNYIELAHAVCKPEWKSNNGKRPERVERYADELPERDFYEGDSPDY